MRATVAPPPGGCTLPTWMSCTRLLGRLTLSTTALSTVASRSSGTVSLNAPRLALVMAVRTALTITTSSSLLGLCAGLTWAAGDVATVGAAVQMNKKK